MLGSLFKRNNKSSSNLNQAVDKSTKPPLPAKPLTSPSKKAMLGGQNSKPLMPKNVPIIDEYSITDKVLGLGINGKVVECYDRATGNKFALKVTYKMYLRRICSTECSIFRDANTQVKDLSWPLPSLFFTLFVKTRPI